MKAPPVKIDAGIVGVGVAITVAILAALWKMAGLRSEVLAAWSDRVQIVRASLDERASEELLALHARITEMLPSLTEPFDPTKLIVDPGVLQVSVSRFLGLLGARARLRHRYHLLLAIGPVMSFALIGGLISSCLAFSYFTGFTRYRTLGYIGIWIGLAAGATIVAGYSCYLYLQLRLSSAEILAAGNSS